MLKHLPAMWRIPGLGRSPGEGNATQYSCLENSMDGGPGGLHSPWGCKESDMTEQLHLHKLMFQAIINGFAH